MDKSYSERVKKAQTLQEMVDIVYEAAESREYKPSTTEPQATSDHSMQITLKQKTPAS